MRALRKAGGITDAKYGCGIHIRITSCPLKRTDDARREVICKGYWFEVFVDEQMTIPLDVFGGAVGFEMVENSMDQAVQFMKDVVEAEEKRYWEVLKEME